MTGWDTALRSRDGAALQFGAYGLPFVMLSHSANVSVAKLPLAAILNRGTGPSVYVVDTSGALELRPVKVAAFTEDTALVTSGVSNGDRIVRLGVQKLDAGERVRAVGEQ